MEEFIDWFLDWYQCLEGDEYPAVFDELYADLFLYEPNPELRAMEHSYFGDKKLKSKLMSLLDRL